MAERLVFEDPYAAADLLTFAGRAARVGDGAVHLQAFGGLLVVSAAPLVRQGLLDATPTIMGMRVLPIDPELECDLLVDAATLRAAPEEPTQIELPDTALESTLWSRTDLPRSGWEPTGRLTSTALAERAQWGLSAVAHALPDDPGDPIVQAVRGRIWSALDEYLDDMPRGVAFAAWSLGFLGADDETATVRRVDRWIRISLRRGHVLLRGPAHTGITEVRDTGARSG